MRIGQAGGIALWSLVVLLMAVVLAPLMDGAWVALLAATAIAAPVVVMMQGRKGGTRVEGGGGPASTESDNSLAEPLSERELEVLAQLGTGRSNKEIAQQLIVSVGTVKTHTNNIYRKLGVRNRAEALAKARRLQLV